MLFGTENSDGISGVSNMSITTFATNGSNLLITLVPGNASNVFASQVLLAYEAINCSSCGNGVCTQGVCICNPGWGGEDCLVDLVSDACSNTTTYIQGAELSGAEGNLTVLAPYFAQKANFIYPRPHYEGNLLPTNLNCDWIFSKDYTIMSLQLLPLVQHKVTDVKLRVYDGLTRDNTSELIWEQNSFDQTSLMVISGGSGELQVEFNTNIHSQFGDGDNFRGLSLRYLAQNIWYVAPNSDFYFDSEATLGSASAPFFSIQDALDQADDDDILLLYPGTYQTVDISISKPITIKSISGPEYTTLEGSDVSRILSIETVGNVNLNGLSFMNGYADDGGAIKVTLGYVSIIHCHFVGNSARNGGAVYIQEPATFNLFSVYFHDGVAEYGGAIYADSSLLEIDTVEFHGNYAEVYGGAVYLDSSFSTSLVLNLENGFFDSNEASNGAGIYSVKKCSMTLDTITFLKNTAKYGSGLYVRGSSTAVISSLTATGNSATYGSFLVVLESSTIAVNVFSILENDGTPIHAVQATIEFDQGVFSQNSGDLYGVAYIQDSSMIIQNAEISNHVVSALRAYDGATIQISNATLRNNSADNFGGVLVLSDTSKALVDSVIASENKAPVGGVFWVKNCPDTGYGLAISNSLFFNNTAKLDFDDAGLGGCIYADSGNVNITNSSFIENYADADGGVLYLFSDDTSSFVGSFNNYTHNQAYRGGCFYLDDNSVATSHMDLFIENQAFDDGGVWLVSYSEITLSHQRYYGCKSGGQGGGLLIMLYSVATIEEIEFIECTANVGGAMSVRSESSITGTHINVIQCSAEHGGGMAFQEESTVVLDGGLLFQDNGATIDGGALYLVRIDVPTTMLDGAVFINNQADETGGAIYSALCDSVIFTNITSSANKAAAGSDICALSSVVTLNDSLIEGSSSDTGALYLLHATVHLNRITMRDQETLINGGAIYAFSTELVITSSTFQNGSAKEEGGAMYLFETDITVINSEFSFNEATLEGGALYVTDTDAIYISGCSFYYNNAGTVGGAIYIENVASFLLMNSDIQGNQAAEQGAGVALQEIESVVITDCRISHNNVTQTDASALYAGVGLRISLVDYAFISDSSFVGNYGVINGGAIFFSYTAAYVENSIFSANQGYYGGAIYCGPELSTSSANYTVEEYRRLENLSPNSLRPRLPYSLKRQTGWRKKRALQQSLHPTTSGARLLAQQSYIYLEDCSFKQNSALSGGGALYYEEVEPEGMSTSTFTNNTALYGSSFTAPASYIVATHSGEFEASGKTMSTIRVYLMDSYNQLVESQNGTSIFASVSDADADETTISGTTSVDFIEGIGTFEELIVEKTPNSSTIITFATSLVTGETNLTLNFRPCISGEILPEDSGTCKACSYGTYSWVPGEASCHDCPTGAVCYGGDQVKATLGYWRFANTTGTCDDDDIYDDCTFIECVEEEACIGDIFLTDGAYMSSDYKRIYTGSSGDQIYATLVQLCEDDDGYFPDCTLYFGDGYNVSVIPISDQAITDSYINLAPESTALLKGTVMAGEIYTYDLYLSQEETCAKGYTGNVCNRCDTKYYSGSGTVCQECPKSLALSYFILACGIIGIGICGAIMIKLQMDKENSSNEKLSIMLKIFTSYLQLVSLFGSVDLDWPQLILDLFERQEQISQAGDAIISIECVLNFNYSEQQSAVFYQKFLFYMALPILSVLVSASFWNLVFCYKRRKLSKKPWDYAAAGLDHVIKDGMVEHYEVKETLERLGENSEPLRVDAIIKYLDMKTHPARVEDFQEAWLIAYKRVLDDNAILSVIVFLFMLHPNIAQYTFSVFTCEELRTGHEYLSEDLETECYTVIWNRWAILGIACILIYTLGIPAFGFYVLHSVRHDLEDKFVKLKYGFLYDGYEPKYYWWEMWVMMRKVMVTFIIVFVEPVGPLTEVTTSLGVVFFATCLHLRCQPYEDEDLDHLESYSLYATSITLFMGIYFYCDEFGNAVSEGFFIALIILANLAFVLYFIKAGYYEFQNKILESIEKVMEMVGKFTHGKELRAQRAEYTQVHKDFVKETKKSLSELEDKIEERNEMQDAITTNKANIHALSRTVRQKLRQNENLLADLNSLDDDIESSKALLGERFNEHHPDFLKLLKDEFRNDTYDKLVERVLHDLPVSSMKKELGFPFDQPKAQKPSATTHPIFLLHNHAKMEAELQRQVSNRDFIKFTQKLKEKEMSSDQSKLPQHGSKVFSVSEIIMAADKSSDVQNAPCGLSEGELKAEDLSIRSSGKDTPSLAQHTGE